MNTHKRHRFLPDIISYAVWLYYRFNLSHRDIEDLLAQRGITVSREAIRLWFIKFEAIYSRGLKRKRAALTGDRPDLIVTANVGCQLHLADETGPPVCHWLELLDPH